MPRATAYIESSRHSVFYFRIRVPSSARSAIACTHIRRSLRTKSRRKAVLRGASLLEQIELMFKAAERGEIIDVQSLTWSSAETQLVVSAADGPVATSKKLEPCRRLSDVWKSYEKLQRLEGVSEKTIGDKESLVALLIRIIGDMPVRNFGRKEALKFKEVALKLPPRLHQLPKQSISQLIEQAIETISVTTFNNYVKNLMTIFKFAKREGECDSNPFDGLKIKQRIKASTQRSRFTEDDLAMLFSGDSYPDKEQKFPYRFWLPYLGLYTGARLNELCQLYLDDFVTVHGVDCIHIRAQHPDQRLKNMTSERLVPIHSKLKTLGLMEFVNRQKTRGCERLFPELHWNKCHGYGSAPSKWFARYRASLGFKGGDERKDFHSFRHTVADHLKQQGVPESLVGGLLGHTTGGITFSRYGKDWKPETMVEVVEALKWLW